MPNIIHFDSTSTTTHFRGKIIFSSNFFFFLSRAAMSMSDSSSYNERSVSPWSLDELVQVLKDRLERMEIQYQQIFHRYLEKAKDDIVELKDVVKKIKARTDSQESKKKKKEKYESFSF